MDKMEEETHKALSKAVKDGSLREVEDDPDVLLAAENYFRKHPEKLREQQEKNI